MSTQVTEAHRKLAADLCRHATGSNRALHHVPKFAQLIADSEARAVQSALHDRASSCGVCRGEIGMVCVHLSSVKTDSDNLARKAESLRLQATEAQRDHLRAELAAERETSRLLKVAMDARDEGYTQSRRHMSTLERELATERERLDHVLRIECTFDDRADIDNDMKEVAK